MSDHAAIDRPGPTEASFHAVPARHAAPISHRDRYAAVIAALIDVRPDEASARFDAEIATALADQRIDAQTARTLRWWQRASVRAAESYAASVVPGVLAVRDEADAIARRDAADAAASWRTALKLATSAAPAGNEPAAASEPPTSGPSTELPSTELQSTELPITELAAVRLIAVPDPAPHTSRTTPDQTRRAIKAAFAPDPAGTADITSSPLPVDLVATTVTTERKDRRHDNPATSA